LAFRLPLLPLWYFLPFLPRNNKIWLFGSHFGKGYGDNSRALFEYLLKNQEDYQVYWLTKSKDVYARLKNEKIPVIYAGSLKGWIMCIRAGVVFINHAAGDFIAHLINGSKQVILWHGLMIKTIGHDARKYRSNLLRPQQKVLFFFQRTIMPYFHSYKPWLVINTSDFFSPFFRSAFRIEKNQIAITGYPRNDFLSSCFQEKIIQTLNGDFDNPFIILYLPTWRDAYRYNGLPFDPFGGFGFSSENLDKYLKSHNAIFLYKGHYHNQNSTQKDKISNRFFDLNHLHYEELYYLIKDVDLLITDYSSVYFDFLLVNKPIVLAHFDHENYVKLSRNLYYDYFEEIKGAKAKDWPELMNILDSKSYSLPSKTTINKFHHHFDHKSCFRVHREVVKRLNSNN